MSDAVTYESRDHVAVKGAVDAAQQRHRELGQRQGDARPIRLVAWAEESFDTAEQARAVIAPRHAFSLFECLADERFVDEQ